jgi:hypothetical protein
MAYTNRFVGGSGNDANDGSTWALRKLTLTSMEAALSAATRYKVYVGPGTYRELLTLGVSGPAAYATGTVSVTLGSLTVTGSGTAWLTNAEANDYFQVLKFASGTDGVTNGTSTFTSAAGNFQSGHVGMSIRINTKVAGIIATVVSATEITLKDTANAALTPSAGSGLTYDVGPSGPIKIASVESDTSLTLAAAWDFPTLTGLAYRAWGHVEYIGDYLGTNTDGVGGVVRVTGSDNDQATARANCITATSRNQRAFTGFQFDTTSGAVVTLITSCSNWVIDKCIFVPAGAASTISVGGTGTGVTVQGSCLYIYPTGNAVIFTHSSVVDNAAGVVQNCFSIGGGQTFVQITRVGGILLRNCQSTARMVGGFVQVATAVTVGQTITVLNNIIYGASIGLNATVVGEILENYNNLFATATNRTNTTTGANSLSYPPLFDTRWFFQMVFAGAGPYSPLQVISPFDLSSYSQLINVAGFNPPTAGLRGTTIQDAQRELGPFEYDITLKYFGGIKKSRLVQGH